MKDSETKEAIDFMLQRFKPERYAYLTVTILSFLILLYCVIQYLIGMGANMGKENLAPIFGMVGSGGAVAYTASQLLRMWRDCMTLVTRSLDERTNS